MPAPADDDANTPLSFDEQAALIPNLSTKQELNEWERENILAARTWALRHLRRDLLHREYIRELHRRMFDQTWKWAGTFRQSEKNLGIRFLEIPVRLESLLQDAKYWTDHRTYPPEEIAIRLHHQLTLIHPFPNGNGRHARLMADLLAAKLRAPVFTWGSTDLVRAGETRRIYINALHAADRGDVSPLLAFARS